MVFLCKRGEVNLFVRFLACTRILAFYTSSYDVRLSHFFGAQHTYES